MTNYHREFSRKFHANNSQIFECIECIHITFTFNLGCSLKPGRQTALALSDLKWKANIGIEAYQCVCVSVCVFVCAPQF